MVSHDADFNSGVQDAVRAARLFLYRAFVAGLNAYVNEVLGGRQPLPPEFTLTGSAPDHWSADDVVRIRSHGLIGNLDSEVARARVACLAGLDADQLRVKLEPAHVDRGCRGGGSAARFGFGLTCRISPRPLAARTPTPSPPHWP